MLGVAIHSAPPPTTQPLLVVLNDVLACEGPGKICVFALYSVFTHAPPPVTYHNVFQPMKPNLARALASHWVLAAIWKLSGGITGSSGAPRLSLREAQEK